MKITIIHGQNHKGSTYHIGKIFLTKYMETAGPGITGEGENGGTAEVNEFFLPRDLPHFCLGSHVVFQAMIKSRLSGADFYQAHFLAVPSACACLGCAYRPP